ncbi:MAG: sulfotransferase [Magnetovibrio sp.]|nr:sulfotransferase [Magnetovibrio sp.]
MQNILAKGYELHRAGRHKQALQHYKSALKQAPKNSDALMLMGILQYELGKHAQAVQYLSKALKQSPNNAAIYYNLGLAYQSQNRLSDAANVYAKANKLEPNNPSTLFCLGSTLVKLGDAELGVSYLRQAQPAMPDNPELSLWLGIGLQINGDLDNAIIALRKVLEREPDSVPAMCALAEMPATYVRPIDALTYVQKAYALAPNAPRVMLRYATFLEKQNKLDEAKALFQGVLNVSTDFVLAEIGLAKIDLAQKKPENAIQRLNGILKKDVSTEMRSEALGVLCKAQARLKQYNAAFETMSIKGAMVSELPQFNHLNKKVIETIFQKTHAWFDSGTQNLTLPNTASNITTPIFFIGFPRSGTTLMEMMLASHPALQTSAELPALGTVLEYANKTLNKSINYPHGLNTLSDDELSKLRALYWNTFEGELEFDPCDKTVVDKNPINILYLPLVRVLFPQAKIIFALRDPRDVCISNMMQNFALNIFMMHMTDMESTAQLYADSMKLYRHSVEALDLSVHEYRYEDLIDDYDKTINNIFSYLGLSLDESVSNYQDTARNSLISTPSYADVSKGLNRRAIGQWKSYTHLMPKALDILADDVKRYGYEEIK